ncbi:hypothetical protein LJK88_14370 [Paenibacillus sp. P26]|nr:hypothetical protein LJK88_14370 [Paenibacillus sp. P26]
MIATRISAALLAIAVLGAATACSDSKPSDNAAASGSSSAQGGKLAAGDVKGNAVRRPAEGHAGGIR